MVTEEGKKWRKQSWMGYKLYLKWHYIQDAEWVLPF